MKLLLLFLGIAVVFCDASNIICQYYTKNESLLLQLCDNYKYQLPKDCPHKLTDLPALDVRRLKIQGCDSREIRDASEQYGSIEQLDISHAGLNSLDDAVLIFAELTDLNASSNALTEIPKKMLNKCPKLKTLDLSYNYITRVNHGDFEQSQQYNTINLSHNMLESIHIDAFANLSDLQTILLSHNRLSAIPSLHFLNHPITVDLAENPPLTTFNCAWIAAMSPAQMFLTWRYIKSFSGTRCGGLKFKIERSDNGTAIEGVSRLKTNWKLHCNEQSFRNLQYFVAGPVAFQNIHDILPLISATVWKLDLTNNDVNALNQSGIERFRRLSDLRLRNTKLKTFDVGALNRNSDQYLNHLDLSYNHLKGLENPRFLQYFANLLEFSITGNLIHFQNLSEIIQNLPPSVQRLNMARTFSMGAVDDKNGKMLAKNTFERLPAITDLDLSDTEFKLDDFSVFQPLQRLTNLNISGNDLSQVNAASLASLYQLQDFRAAYCQIENISELIHHLGPYIETLDLSQNLAPKIDARAFERLPNLKELKLDRMGLQEIDSSTFEPLTSLTHLDLHGNLLEEIDVERFPRSLQKLRLDGNNLKEIKHLNRTRFPALNSLTLSQNHLDCDYLDELRAQFNDRIILVDAFKQKNGTCHSNLLTIILWIVAAIVVLLILVCICFLCRKRLCRKSY